MKNTGLGYMDGHNLKDNIMDQIREKILLSIKNLSNYHIRLYGRSYLDFWKIKNEFLKEQSKDIHHLLGMGREPLSNIDECIQYWKSYCTSIIPRPWNILHEKYHDLNMHKQDIEIFDYAAGQGQASILLLDHFYDNGKYWISRNKVKKINLIDKSNYAVNLGKDILNIHSPEIAKENIYSLCKDINDLVLEDFSPNSESYKIHLFSYILDMGVIDSKKLIEKILAVKGKHFIWATSQQSDRDWNKNQAGKYYFDEFYEELDNQINYSQNVVRKAQRYQIDLLKDKFNTSNKELPCAIFGRYIEVK